MARSRPAALCLLALLLATGCANEPTSGAGQRDDAVPEQSMADVSRGRLLYRNTCATCHSEQAHWREKSVVHTWSDLLFQVTRWQNIAGQQWRPQDIEDVAAYLNRRFYQLPCPVPGCTGDGLAQSADQDGNSYFSSSAQHSLAGPCGRFDTQTDFLRREGSSATRGSSPCS